VYGLEEDEPLGKHESLGEVVEEEEEEEDPTIEVAFNNMKTWTWEAATAKPPCPPSPALGPCDEPIPESIIDRYGGVPREQCQQMEAIRKQLPKANMERTMLYFQRMYRDEKEMEIAGEPGERGEFTPEEALKEALDIWWGEHRVWYEKQRAMEIQEKKEAEAKAEAGEKKLPHSKHSKQRAMEIQEKKEAEAKAEAGEKKLPHSKHSKQRAMEIQRQKEAEAKAEAEEMKLQGEAMAEEIEWSWAKKEEPTNWAGEWPISGYKQEECTPITISDKCCETEQEMATTLIAQEVEQLGGA
jgi:hypothetical protein